MTITLGTLKTQILNETQRDSSEFGSYVQSAILSSIKFMEAEHPYVFQKGGTLTISSGSNTASLPSDLNQLIYASYTVGPSIYNASVGFNAVNFSDLLSFFSSTSETGNPLKYSMFGGLFYVYPYTQSDITFTLYYYYTDSSYPQTDSDTSVWFDDHTVDCVRAKATEEFYRYTLQTPEKADQYLTSFATYLNNLRARNVRQFNNQLSI